MKSWARELALGLVLTTAIPSAPLIAAQSAEQVLIKKANYWRLKDRPDLAIEALNQLLSIDPNQPDALYQYGMIEVQQGKLDSAKNHLARLRKAAPTSPRIAELANAIRVGQVSPGELSEARKLAQTGQFAEAAKKYQQSFQGPPPPAFGVEYYMTLAGTPQGWDEARRGLENLVRNAPNDSKAKVALGEVLTYHAETRARGIAMLEPLASDPAVGAHAARAWKQAVLWLGGSAEDRRLYGEYIAKFPQDTEVRQHMASAEKATAGGPASAGALAYSALNRGDVAAAERRFAADLHRNPDDPDALAGLGLVRLRQQRFGQARELLGRAMRAAPSQRHKWAAAYDSAVFWGGINEAKAAIAAGNDRQAHSILAGLSRTRSDSWNAQVLLGDVDARLGDYAGAEQAYRRALAARPDNATALVGLYTALTAEGKTAEAAGLSARVAALGPRRLGGVNRARADLLRSEGKNLEARGDVSGAHARYQEAIAVDPNDAWARLDDARFLARHGSMAEAMQIIDPAASGDTAESLHAAAIFYSEQNRPEQAVALLDRIPAGSRGADIAALRERLRVTGDIDHAKRLARAGNRAAARNLLMSLYSRAPRTPEKTRLIADALADVGATNEALQLARPPADAAHGDVRRTLDYAALLVRAGRNEEAVAYLTRAERSGGVNAGNRGQLERLKAEIAARRAEHLRERGDFAGAYDQISPLLSAYPSDPTLLLAAGRIYAAAGKNDIAMRFVDAAFRQAPGDVNVIRGAVGGAIVAGDLTRASAYLGEGMRLFPNNPRLYYLAAQIARANGDNGAAMRDLQVARRLNIGQAGAVEPVSAAAPPVTMPGAPARLPPNPFRQSQATPPQSPFRLASATAPIVATEGSSTPPESTSSLPEFAGSADSDDLIVPPHAGERPPRPTAFAPALADNDAVPPQVALLPAPADPDIAAGAGESTPPAPPPRVPTARRHVAQLEPLPPPPIQTYEPVSYAPPPAPVAAAAEPALAPLPPPPIAGYQPPAFGQRVPAPQGSLELDIERSMAAIAAQAGPTLQGGLAFRARDGENGLSRLTEIGAPIEGVFSPFYTGTLRLQAVPTFLSAGTPSANALLRFGQDPLLASGPRDTTTALPSPGNQNAGGVSFNVAYAYRMFSGEVGTTPLGFPVENLVGRVALVWPGPTGASTAFPAIPPVPTTVTRPFQVRVEGARQPVVDSLLSYAGTRDPVSGLVWGGVIKTGGDALVSYDDGQIGVYGGGGFWSIDGKSVANNSEAEGLIGGFVRPYRTPDSALKVGVNLTFLGYEKNLRFFTFGQGGYFSPQTYVNFSVPVEFTGRSGRLSYLVGGALGVQTFDEKRSPYFPTDAGKQAALQASFGNAAFYPARSVTGLSFLANGQVEYQLDNGFSVGGLASIDNAQDFTEGIAKVYLRKSFGVAPTTASLPYSLPGSL